MNCELINIPNEDNSLIEQIFINRGFKKEDIFHYLNTTEEDILDPELLDNMETGARLLEDCIVNFKKVFIIPDVDADGFTSAAILINYLSRIAPIWVKECVSYEINEGKHHGIILENIPEDVSLVICPDSASNDYEQHKILTLRGINVLVLDHHDAEKVSEDACIINNQLCNYPNKSLSGAGVVFKFCSYLDKKYNTIGLADEFRDLAALGMISDMVSLKDFETKHLIKTGLSSLRNPYFKAMCKKNEYSIGDELTPIGIAFYITPYINATIRMGSKSEKQTLFESMLDLKAYEEIPSTKRGCKGQMETRVEQACRNCTNIKNRQTRARDASLERVEELIKSYSLLDFKILTILLPKEYNFEATLTGLIANQLMAKYQRPVLLLRQGEKDGEIIWEGSARGLNQSTFSDFKSYISNTGLFDLAQGHANAFGAAILDKNVPKFMTNSSLDLANYNFDPCYKVDCIFEGKHFNADEVLTIGNLSSVWGQGVEEPLVLIKNLPVTKDKLTLMKGNTLKIQLDNGCSLIRFKSSEEEYNALYSDLGCVRINVVGRCDKNVWNGRTTAQIKVVDIEIVSEEPYYF